MNEASCHVIFKMAMSWTKMCRRSPVYESRSLFMQIAQKKQDCRRIGRRMLRANAHVQICIDFHQRKIFLVNHGHAESYTHLSTELVTAIVGKPAAVEAG